MKTFRKSSTWLSLGVVAALLVGSLGCAKDDFKPSKIFSLDNAWPFDDDEDEPEEGIPVRIVGAWTDTMMTVPGQKAQRGFGGRLMFYDKDNEKPILVDGQLVVYAFDEAGRAPTDTKPTRRYVFPPDQVKVRMSKNDMGASYSFWLPWDEAGGPKADVSLICRFEPKGGAVITSEQTRHNLPGAMRTETAAAPGAGLRVPEGVPMRPAQVTLEQYQAQQQAQSGVQTAAYNIPADAQSAAPGGVVNAVATEPARQMSVTSIALPNDFQIPEGVTAQPITKAVGQVGRPQQVQRPASSLQYQQPQYQQPAAVMQPVTQAAQPAIGNGAAMMPQIPAMQAQLQTASALPQRPMMSPTNMQGIYVPQNQGFAAPMTAQQHVGQQGATLPNGQPMMAPGGMMPAANVPVNRMPQQQVGMMPQQQMVGTPMQPQTTMPVQPMVPQQGAQQASSQQLPSASGVRTAVSYGPATIPWR